jgi:hypothetical protein
MANTGANKRSRGNNSSPHRSTRARGPAGTAAAASPTADTSRDSDEEVVDNPTAAAAITKPAILDGFATGDPIYIELNKFLAQMRSGNFTVDTFWDHYSFPTAADLFSFLNYVVFKIIPNSLKVQGLEKQLAEATAQLAALREQLKESNNSVVMPIFIGEVVRLVDAKCIIPNIRSSFYLSKVACTPKQMLSMGGVNEKHPFVESVWAYVFQELEKPYREMGGKVPAVATLDSCNVYTNGQPHPWNTPEKHKELWLSTKGFGPDQKSLSEAILKKWNTKRNHLASWYRRRLGMYWLF